MIYHYKAVSEAGEIIEGSFDVENEEEVILMLKINNYMPISIEKNISRKIEISLFSPKVGKKDLAVFCRQFSTMLDAGVGVVKCIEILEKQTENKYFVKILGKLHDDVQKGLNLSQAMNKHRKVFPPLIINMVNAGEYSGKLDNILKRMAIYYEKENKLQNKIKSTLIYPTIVGVVSIIVVIFLLVMIIPTFIVVFESSSEDLPVITKLLLSISNNLIKNWKIYLFSVLVIAIGFTNFKKTNVGKENLDMLKLKIPIIKNVNIKIITSRFTRTLSILISSGMPLLQSIEIAGEVIGNKVVQDKLELAVKDISKGLSLSKTIENIKIFPPMVDSMINIGEESGTLDDILYKTADFYDDEAEVGLERTITLIEPFMIIIMAIIVGFIVIAMASPMFDMINII